MLSRLSHTAALALAIAALTACSAPQGTARAPAATADEPRATAPVAVVGGVEITDAALAQRVGTITADADVRAAIDAQPALEVQLVADVTGQMVEAELIAQAAPDLGVETTDADLQAYVDEIVAGYLGGGDDAWSTFLAERGYPETEVRDQLREDLRRERLKDVIAPDVVVPDAEVATTYATGYAGRPQVSHVLVAEEAEAAQVLADLRAGEDFATVARASSLDDGTAAAGGALGPWSKGDLTPNVDEAIERARDGDVVGPVQSPFGWHVVRRDVPASFEAVAPQIRERLVEARQNDAVTAWVATLRPTAEVSVRPDIGQWDPQTGRVAPPPQEDR